MVKTCIVKGCKQECYRGCGVSFHAFPPDQDLKQLWMEAVNRDNVSNCAAVCSLHFQTEDYITPTSNKLKPLAVPSVCLTTLKNEKDKPVSKFCRVCLAFDVKMYEIKELNLDQMFESITGLVDTQPKKNCFKNLCWECAARLSSAAAFKDKALLSDALLQGLLKGGGHVKKKHIEAIKDNYSGLKSSLTAERIYNSVDHYKQYTSRKNVKIEYLDHDKIQASLDEAKKKPKPIPSNLIKENTPANTPANIPVKIKEESNTTIPSKLHTQKNLTPLFDDNDSDYYEYEYLEEDIISSEDVKNINKDEKKLNQGETSLNENETNLNQGETSLNEDDNNLNEDETNLNDNDSNFNDDENTLNEDENSLNEDENTLNEDDNSLNENDNTLNEDENSLNEDEIPLENIEMLEEYIESDPLVSDNQSECSVENDENITEDCILKYIDHNYTMPYYVIKQAVSVSPSNKNDSNIEKEDENKFDSKSKVNIRNKKDLNVDKSARSNVGKQETRISASLKRTLTPMEIVKKYETTHIKRKRDTDDFDTSLFTITPKTYEEQVQEILQRKESKKYKEAPLKCNICYHHYYSQKGLMAHTIKHSDAYGSYECFICKIRKKTSNTLRKHLTDRHTEHYKCKKCPFETMHRTTAKSHADYHKGTTYRCPNCDLVFTKISTYMGHLRLKHLCDFVCELCGYMFLSKRGVDVHKNIKHSEDKNMELKGPYCDVCDVKFLSEDAYERHLRLSSRHTYESDPNRLRNEYTYKPNIVEKPYAGEFWERRSVNCEECDKQFPNRRQYAQHFRRAHPDKSRVRKYKTEPTMCEHCGKMFLNKFTLRDHMWVHTGEKLYKCDKCPKAFTSKQSLRVHFLFHEGISTSATCPMCGKRFSSETNKKRHMFTHTGLKPHICDICDKRFTWGSELKSHVNHVHLNHPWPKRVRQRRKVPKTPESESEE